MRSCEEILGRLSRSSSCGKYSIQRLRNLWTHIHSCQTVLHQFAKRKKTRVFNNPSFWRNQSVTRATLTKPLQTRGTCDRSQICVLKRKQSSSMKRTFSASVARPQLSKFLRLRSEANVNFHHTSNTSSNKACICDVQRCSKIHSQNNTLHSTHLLPRLFQH